MAFSSVNLPMDVREAFHQGILAWPLAVQRALKWGIKDLSKLTDIVFFMHHPERGERALQSHETKLIEEWKAFRYLVKPLIEFPQDFKEPGKTRPTVTSREESAEDQLAAAKAHLKQMKLDGELTQAQYDVANQLIRDVLKDAGTTVRWLNFTLTLANLIKELPIHAGVAGATMTALGASVGVIILLGPFLQFIGFVLLLDEAMDTDLQIYRAVAAAYGITAWAYGESTPSQCKMVRDRLLKPVLYGRGRDEAVLDRNWRNASIQARSKLELLTAKLGAKTDPKIARNVMQSALQTSGKVDLAKSVILQIANSMPAKRQNQENALTAIARDLKYPH